MGAPFTHLHLHTEYSLLDGLCQVDQLVEQGKALGMDAMGLTDHGALYAVVDFYRAAKDAKIKPIIGLEGYLAAGSRLDHSPAAGKQPYHVTLLAKNNKGYQNLLQLATKAQLEGFYYKPRIDHELLAKHAEGLIVFSGCLNGEVPRLLQEGRSDDARKAARWFKDTVGDFYFEIQQHDAIPELEPVNQQLIALAHDLGIPTVATNDVHYIHQHDHRTQDVLLCIQTNTQVGQSNRMKMSDPSYYLRSTEEMESLFSGLPEAILSTRHIADMCDVSIDFNRPHLPKFPTPNRESAEEYLSRLCWEGMRWRYGEASEEHERRLRYELDVIQKTRFSDYFLIVWDILKFARERGILFGVRGSAAASLVLFTLGVTNVDPLKYRLVFERFLNIERREMPDIDMDFEDDRREEVIAHVVRTYGEDRVAQIITFGTLGAKAALRDTGRALGLSYADVDGLARLIPPGYRKGPKGEIMPWTINGALDSIPEFKEKYDADAKLKELVDTSRSLEGVVRNASTHAAGVVISDEPLVDYVPLQRSTKGGVNENGIAVTQFSMGAIAKLGLLKMDFLGLINLQILKKTCDFITRSTGREVDLLEIPLDDPNVFKLLSSGETSGLFQLESTGMRRYIKELRPTSLGDLSAMIALYRPGPLEHIPAFIDSKHGRREVTYPHEILGNILQETYGIIVYQDQVLMVLREFAGYSMGQADIVRKAMGKKDANLMRQEKERFIRGALEKGFSAELAGRVWDLIEPFAGYAFNKAHSISYALIAYWTAYFKANYPVEFMAALLTCFQGSADKVATTIAECRRLGIDVLAPDINQASLGFVIEPQSNGKRGVRFSLSGVKNIGEAAVKPIIEEREKAGPFKSIEDFCRRAPLNGLNRRTLETLIKVGALNSFGGYGGLLANVDRILSIANQQSTLRNTGQTNMFDLFGTSVPVPLPELDLTGEEVPLNERLQWQKELLGTFLDDHPLARAAQQLGVELTFCGQIDSELENHSVTIAGTVTAVRRLETKKDHKPFVVAEVADLTGKVSVMAWPEIFARTSELWQQEELIVVRGKVRRGGRDDELTVACESAQSFAEATANRATPTPSAAARAAADDEVPPVDLEDDVAMAAPVAAFRPEPALHRASPPESGPSIAIPSTALQAHEEAPVAAPIPVAAVTAVSRPVAAAPVATALPTPPAPQGNGKNGHSDPAATSRVRRSLLISLHETANQDADLARLWEIVGLLRESPGTDLVKLKVVSGGEAHDLDIPHLTVACTEALLKRLVAIVGEDGLKVLF